MKIQKQVPLTEGPILKSLTGLAVPIMISSFLGTLYNITDMAWIGLLGSKAVAAVGVGGMSGCRRDLLHLPAWVDRCMWHSALDAEIKSRHTGMLRQPCSFQSF